MTFGEALERCKHGEKISRSGWNGKEQFVVLARMKECVLEDGTVIICPEHDAIGNNFLLFVGTSGYQCGWLASQTDMLANDWVTIT